jgi:flagellar hook assembly protein FlgD
VFTLTGNQVPSDMRIQIMTVSGKVIREITQAELGNIKIGQNLTEYKWDGTDQFGDKLANGVYLYRVIVKDANGNSFDKYETNTNQFFEQGFGKMYIMR